MRVLTSVILLFVFSIPASAGDVQDANERVARSFFDEVLDQGHLDRYADSHATDFVVHSSRGDFPLSADIAAATEERKALPDMRVAINQVITANDLVVVRWTASGTNTGDGMGFHATGAKINIPGVTIFRLKAGKISEEWGAFDMLTAYMQAGLCQKPRQ
jgi:steroid delta-isomerase-like uncharacterized protein